jgi:hypothetical protein
MTGSGTGPMATSELSTTMAMATEPFCGSRAVSIAVMFTGLPAMPPAALISKAARCAPQARYSPMEAIAPVRQSRNGMFHCFTAEPACEKPRVATQNMANSTMSKVFFIAPPLESYCVSLGGPKEPFPGNGRSGA